MSVADAESTGRVVMYGVSWTAYEQLLDLLQEQHVRVAYDRGRLEIMSPTSRHERLKSLLARCVAGISSEFAIPILSVGSATFRREGISRGVEADEWFYVASEPAVRGKDDIDLEIDPPPDLAIEVDITSTVDARLPIYWALQVTEMWVWRAGVMRFLLRNGDEANRYDESPTSLAFPFLKSSLFTQILQERHRTDDTTFVARFVETLRLEADTTGDSE